MSEESKTSVDTEKTLSLLVKVRTALLRLHKTLLDFEREGYERARGKIDNSYQFLQLVMGDPWFAWLRQLSELIVEMDELLAAKETPNESTAVALIEHARLLLTPNESGAEFQKKYFVAMQASPEVVVAHADFSTTLGPARLTKEIH
jgi:hypothetical protein